MPPKARVLIEKRKRNGKEDVRQLQQTHQEARKRVLDVGVPLHDGVFDLDLDVQFCEDLAEKSIQVREIQQADSCGRDIHGGVVLELMRDRQAREPLVRFPLYR